MPTANAEGRGRSGRYRKTRLAETFVDATLRFDLAPQRSPSACSEESLKIDPETSRWTPLGPTPQVAAAAAWPPTVLCPTARRARGARPECGSSFPKNIPRVLFPQTSRSGGERRGACKPSSVPASEAPFADNHPFLAPGAEKNKKKQVACSASALRQCDVRRTASIRARIYFGWIYFGQLFGACRQLKMRARSNRRVAFKRSRRDAPLGTLQIDSGPLRSPSARPENLSKINPARASSSGLRSPSRAAAPCTPRPPPSVPPPAASSTPQAASSGRRSPSPAAQASASARRTSSTGPRAAS